MSVDQLSLSVTPSLRQRRVHHIPYVSLALMVLGLASACSRTPAPSYYILSSETAPREGVNASLSGVAVGVGPVRLPGRLDRAQVVTRADDVTIQMHSFHRWGDTLQRQVEEGLTHRLGALLQGARVMTFPWERAQRPSYQVLITVLRFEGRLSDQVTLDATWQVVLRTNYEVKLTRRFTESVSLKRSTTDKALAREVPDYVRAMSRLLDSFGQQISSGLIELGSPNLLPRRSRDLPHSSRASQDASNTSFNTSSNASSID